MRRTARFAFVLALVLASARFAVAASFDSLISSGDSLPDTGRDVSNMQPNEGRKNH